MTGAERALWRDVVLSTCNDRTIDQQRGAWRDLRAIVALLMLRVVVWIDRDALGAAAFRMADATANLLDLAKEGGE